MKIIAVEEHFQPTCYRDYLLSRKKPPRLEIIEDKKMGKLYCQWITDKLYNTSPGEIYDRSSDIGEGRLREMDEMGIEMQVLSYPVGRLDGLEADEATIMVMKINEELSAAISRHPDRFAGFASLDLSNPAGAAGELERAVKQLGFRGAMIVPHVMGEYIDDRKYWPMFEMGARLGVPFYMHPTAPPPASRHQYAGYPDLSHAMWGFAAETGLTAMRLIASGIFDEYPDLKIILGHMGESLPYWMSRLDNRMLANRKIIPHRADGTPAYTPLADSLKKLPSQYILENFYITTSGVMWTPALLCSLLALGAERILFATDYPNESLQESLQFIETAPISPGDREKIFHRNAEELFKL